MWLTNNFKVIFQCVTFTERSFLFHLLFLSVVVVFILKGSTGHTLRGFPLTSPPRSVPQDPANWYEFRIPEWKKRGEWTTRRLDYGWCVDLIFFHFVRLLAVGVWLVALGLSVCVAGQRDWLYFGTTAAPSMLFQKYLQCRVCCHHSFWLFLFLSFFLFS